MLSKGLAWDAQDGLLHVPNFAKQAIPFLAIAFCCTIQQRINRLISQAQPLAATDAYRRIPLGFQGDE